jgi:uncharacterized membrane protein
MFLHFVTVGIFLIIKNKAYSTSVLYKNSICGLSMLILIIVATILVYFNKSKSEITKMTIYKLEKLFLEIDEF